MKENLLKDGWKPGREKNIVLSAELEAVIHLLELPGGKGKLYWMQLFTGKDNIIEEFPFIFKFHEDIGLPQTFVKII